MGLFSKKTLICEKCGKEFQARITIGRHLCKECDDKYWKLYADVQGYNEYAMKMSLESYTEEQLIELLASNGMLVKRPIVIQGDIIIIGNKVSEYENLHK